MTSFFEYFVTYLAIALFTVPILILVGSQLFISMFTVLVAMTGVPERKQRSLASKKKFKAYDYDEDN